MPSRTFTGRSAAARLLRALPLAVLALTAAGCASVIHPPDAVARPVPVAVLDHGRHTSLLVGTPDGPMVRYAYGDWAWYALGRTGLGEGSAALLAPSQAALGRKRFPGPLTSEQIGRQVAVVVETAFILDVEVEAARRLVERLDALFAANGAARVVSDAHELEFVPHPDPYSLSHNSNTVVAQWLRELGAEVSGPALVAVWRCPDCR